MRAFSPFSWGAPLSGVPGVAVRGEIDMATAPSLRDALDAAIRESSGPLVVDLRAVGFLDSSGVHLVLGAHARAKASQTHLVIVPGPPQVHRTFELCGVADQLPFVQQPG